MKTKMLRVLFLSIIAVTLQGCIAFPPLVQVEHKESPQNQQEIIRRLAAIDHRLDALEQKVEK
jgi:hypothetical protein